MSLVARQFGRCRRNGIASGVKDGSLSFAMDLILGEVSTSSSRSKEDRTLLTQVSGRQLSLLKSGSLNLIRSLVDVAVATY